jgi:hypothetical protein
VHVRKVEEMQVSVLVSAAIVVVALMSIGFVIEWFSGVIVEIVQKVEVKLCCGS